MTFAQADAESFFREPHVAVMAVTTPAGPPAAVPVWYDVTEDGAIWMLSAPSSRKTRLVETSRCATFVVDTVNPVRFVSVDAELVESRPSTPADVRRVASRYMPAERVEGWVDFVTSTIPDERLYVFRPTRWRFADFSDTP